MKHKYANLDFTPKEINKENKTIRAIFSTGDVDRHGEVVDQKSWQLDDFMKNPVVLFGHDHSQPPVGKVIGLGYNDEGNLEGEIKFAADEYPFANVIWNLYREGYMKAFSVGFSAGKVDIVDNQIILKENKLFEISTVAVPANAFALAKSKGLDVSALEEIMSKKEYQECPCGRKTDDDDAAADAAIEVAADEAIIEDVPETEEVEDIQETPAEEGPDVAEAVQTEETTDDVEDEEDVEKSLSDLITSAKEGRVLSKKNRTILEDALKAITAILEQDRIEEDKSLEDAKKAAFIKVETPSIKMSVTEHTTNKNHLINKAIRALLQEKAKN